MKIMFFSMFAFFVLSPSFAHAYIGPGIGAGTVGIVLGFIASIFLALFAILWYPMKALIKKLKGSKSEAAPVEDANSTAEAPDSDEA